MILRLGYPLILGLTSALTTDQGNQLVQNHFLEPLSVLQSSASFVLTHRPASTQELHEKLSELANPIRQLEDALRSSYAQLAPEQHPLSSSISCIRFWDDYSP